MPKTREEWLIAAIGKLYHVFEQAGLKMPPIEKVKVSCGWPSRGGAANDPNKAHALGQTWATKATEDNTAQVFITPRLSDPIKVLSVLTHELVHVGLDCEHGHRGPFKKYALAVGLEGPMTSTVPSAALFYMLDEVAKELGPYPNSQINPKYKLKKQTTRMLKAVCGGCGYNVRLARIWADIGLPICPVDMVPMELEVAGRKGDDERAVPRPG